MRKGATELLLSRGDSKTAAMFGQQTKPRGAALRARLRDGEARFVGESRPFRILLNASFDMLETYLKILKTPKTVIPTESLSCERDCVRVGKKIENKVKKLFNGSLAIREVDAGSSNAEEQELNALSNSYYDIERFGISFVASPRHADMLLVTGPVSRNMADALRKTYNATPDPKIVVALGDDAIDGGIFKGSYAVYDGVDKIIPVHFYIPGDPPSPSRVLCSLLTILEMIDGSNA